MGSSDFVVVVVGGGGGGRGNRLIASEKVIKFYLLWPIRYRLNK